MDGGETVQLQATVVDPEGDALAFRWETSAGRIVGETTLESIWVAPRAIDEEQTVFVSLFVSDGVNEVIRGINFTIAARGNEPIVPVPLGELSDFGHYHVVINGELPNLTVRFGEVQQRQLSTDLIDPYAPNRLEFTLLDIDDWIRTQQLQDADITLYAHFATRTGHEITNVCFVGNIQDVQQVGKFNVFTPIYRMEAYLSLIHI